MWSVGVLDAVHGSAERGREGVSKLGTGLALKGPFCWVDSGESESWLRNNRETHFLFCKDLFDESGSGWSGFVAVLEGEGFQFGLLVVQLWFKLSTEVRYGSGNNDVTRLVLFLHLY